MIVYETTYQDGSVLVQDRKGNAMYAISPIHATGKAPASWQAKKAMKAKGKKAT